MNGDVYGTSMVETRFEQSYHENAQPTKTKKKIWVFVLLGVLALMLCIGVILVVLRLNIDNRDLVENAARGIFDDGFDAQIKIENSGDDDMRDDIFAHFGLSQESYVQNIQANISAKDEISIDGTIKIGERDSKILAHVNSEKTTILVEKASELLKLKTAESSDDCEGNIACENAAKYYGDKNANAAITTVKKAVELFDNKWIDITAVDSGRDLAKLYFVLRKNSDEIFSNEKLEFVTDGGDILIKIIEGKEDSFYNDFEKDQSRILKEMGIFEGDGVKISVNKWLRKFEKIEFEFNDSSYELNFTKNEKAASAPNNVKSIAEIKNEAVRELKKSDFSIFGDVLEGYYAEKFALLEDNEDEMRGRLQRYLGALDDFLESEGKEPWTEYNATNEYFVTQYIDESARFDEDGKITKCGTVMQNLNGECLDFVATWGKNVIAGDLELRKIYVYKDNICNDAGVTPTDSKFAMIIETNNMTICENN